MKRSGRQRGALHRLAILLHVFWKHGQYGSWFFWFLFGAPFHLFTRFCLWLDTVIFPELRQIEVERPVFIMGHPRSGTTFFQKQIYQSGEVASFSTWEIAFPSLIQRRLLMPLIKLLKKLGVDILQDKEQGHEIRLGGIEEDEALFLHYLDSEIITIFCPWLLIDGEYSDFGFQLGWVDRNGSKGSLKFYRECLKRHIYHTRERQIVAKCNPSIFRLDRLLEVFPDARIVYVVRSPHKSIRSFLAFTERFVGKVLTEEEEMRFFRQKYKWSVRLYKYFEEVKTTIPPDQLLIVPFQEIASEVQVGLHRFFEFTEISPPERYWNRYQNDEENGNHTKKHRNPPLEEFGVSVDEVWENLGFVWTHYLNGDEAREKSGA